jgi:hypothetical protein
MATVPLIARLGNRRKVGRNQAPDEAHTGEVKKCEA